MDQTLVQQFLKGQEELRKDMKELNQNFNSFRIKVVPIDECNRKMTSLYEEIKYERKRRENEYACVNRKLNEKLDVDAWKNSQVLDLKRDGKWLAIIGTLLTSLGIVIGYLI